jgi:putative two-component system response regulator
MTAEKQTILAVDDTPENLDVLVETLKEDYQIKAATNGEMALKIVKSSPPDIILLDIMMPDMDGYEVCRRLKDDYTTRDIPIIFITAKIGIEDELKGLELGAIDYITKPISPPIVKARLKTHLALHDQNRELDRKVREQTQLLHETRLQVIERLGRSGEYKDNETRYHVIRMANYSRIIGLAAGMNDVDADMLMNAAALHDLGKIGIPDDILLKPGKLNDDEFEIMKGHCAIGAEIIGDDDSELFQMAKIVALTHHEKWNGTGYPDGLAGEDIPRIGRIVAIADVFDALTSERPYKQAFPVDDAVKILEGAAGDHFDPQLIKLFVELLPDILDIKAEYSEEAFI